MKDNELIEILKEFDEKRVEQLNDNARKLFYAIMDIANERDRLSEEKQELINYLKEKKEEYIKLYNVSCDIIDFDRYECLKILCEEILSKIEKSDK